MYVGQEVEPHCMDLVPIEDQPGKFQIKVIHAIEKQIDLSDYDQDIHDMHKYLITKHIKVAGIPLTRRDAPMLMKQLLLGFIQQLLNSGGKIDIQQLIISTMKDVIKNFYKYPLKLLAVNKKLNSKDFADENSVANRHNAMSPADQ